MTITVAPKGAVSEQHSQLLADFIVQYPYIKVDGSTAFGESKIPNVKFMMASLTDAIQKLDDDDHAMVLQYHSRLPELPPTHISDMVHDASAEHGPSSPSNTFRVPHPTGIPVPPHPTAPLNSVKPTTIQPSLPPPATPPSVTDAVERPAKSQKKEPHLALTNEPHLGGEGEGIPITFLPRWFEFARLEKFVPQAQEWAEMMGAICCDEVRI